MKTIADRKKAEAYINDLLDGKPMADTFWSTTLPGRINFMVLPVWFPELASLDAFVTAKFTEKLGCPIRRIGHPTLWRLTHERSIEVKPNANVFGHLSITLIDTGEADAC